MNHKAVCPLVMINCDLCDVQVAREKLQEHNADSNIMPLHIHAIAERNGQLTQVRNVLDDVNDDVFCPPKKL